MSRKCFQKALDNSRVGKTYQKKERKKAGVYAQKLVINKEKRKAWIARSNEKRQFHREPESMTRNQLQDGIYRAMR